MTDTNTNPYLNRQIAEEAVAAAGERAHLNATLAGLEQRVREVASTVDPTVAIDRLVSEAGLVARSELNDEVGARIAEAGLSDAVVVRRPSEGTAT
jgi:hypothetical protein